MNKTFEDKIQQWKNVLSGEDKPSDFVWVHDIAKEFKISHSHIINFLKDPSIDSLMSKVNVKTYEMLKTAFYKEKALFYSGVKNSKGSNANKNESSKNNEIVFESVTNKYQCSKGNYQYQEILITLKAKSKK